MTHKATCQTCKQFATFSSRRSIATKDLPLVLAINASAYNEENHAFWISSRTYSFLQPQVEIQGQVEGVDDPEVAVYQLRVRVWPIVRRGSTNYSSGFCCANYLQGEAIASGRCCSRLVSSIYSCKNLLTRPCISARCWKQTWPRKPLVCVQRLRSS